MPTLPLNKLKHSFEHRPQEAERDLLEGLESGDLKPEDFSIRDLFEACYGTEALNAISFRRSGRRSLRDLQEAMNGVDTGAFSNITGQIVFNKLKDGYTFPDALWPQLCETMTTPFLNGERIPGIGEIGDKAEIIGEGMPYPEVGLNEEYTDTSPTIKRGFIVPVTREIIVADRTGLLLQRAGETGKWLGINKEKRVLDVACGVVNNYNRNSVSTSSYLSSGAYVNYNSTNALTDWTSIQTAELMFDGITDPNTGEPIILEAATLLVPSALKRTANRILMASEIAHVDNQANPSTIRTFSPNPMEKGFYGQPKYNVLSNAFVKARSGSATRWWFGDFKKAITYIEAWGIETLQAIDNSELQFTRDIWQRYRVSERGVAQMLEPRRVTQNNS